MAPKEHNQRALQEELVKKGQRYYVPNYKPREMILDRGEGARLWDLAGQDYIDFGAGISVCNLGHCDPDLIAALEGQAQKIWHTSNIFFTEPPIRLAEALVEAIPFAERVYLCNSGAEANEAAIKLARKYAAEAGHSPEEREIITFRGSFHGRTLATVTATAQEKYQQGFEPLPGGFTYCEQFNDPAAISALVTKKTCAIMVEPVQGEGGVIPAKPGFLAHLRKLCDETGALLILDEIQCGLGRTGTLTAHEQDGVEPDIMTLAKALGGGLPIGAILVGKKAAETFQFGAHGSTFGGNPVMSAVALAAFQKLRNPELLAGVGEKAAWLRGELARANEALGLFSEIRGRGLMIGAALKDDWKGKAAELSEVARKNGLLVLVAGPDVLRFLPPLTITQDELTEGMKRLEQALADHLEKQGADESLLARAKRLLKGE